MTEKQKPVASLPESWPASEIVARKVTELVPYARNPKQHPPEQVDALARSIEEWGFTNPILVDENGQLIAGHGRLLAAEKLGLKTVPTIIARGWTDAQRRAYVIADNKLAESPWDRDLLTFELNELELEDFDLDLTGFGDREYKSSDGVAKVDVPKAVNYVWALVGVPIGSMGRLAAAVERLREIEDAIVEVSDDVVAT